MKSGFQAPNLSLKAMITMKSAVDSSDSKINECTNKALRLGMNLLVPADDNVQHHHHPPHNILFFKLRPCLSLREPQFGGHGRDRSIKFFVFINTSSSQIQCLYYMFPQTNKKYQKQKCFSMKIGIFFGTRLDDEV